MKHFMLTSLLALGIVGLLLPATGTAETVVDNLLAYWNFDEADGATADNAASSSPDLDGTLIWYPGDSHFVPAGGKVDGGVSLNGAYVKIDNEVFADNTPELSYNFWFQYDEATSMSPHNRMMLRSTPFSGSWVITARLLEDGGNVSLDVQTKTAPSGEAQITTDVTSTYTDWNMVTVTFESGTGGYKLYLNGSFIASEDVSGTLDVTDGLNIGGMGGSYWYGMLDEVAFWDRALSTDEIAFLWNDGAGNAISGSSSLPGDLDGDGFVGSADLDIVRGNWGQTVSGAAEGDPSGDGTVGSADLDIVRGNWGGTAAGAAVPEPSALALLFASIASIFAIRRR